MALSDRLQLLRATRAVRSGSAAPMKKRTTLTNRFPAIETVLARSISAEMRRTAKLVEDDARSRLNEGPPDIHLRDRMHVVREAPATYAVIAGDEEAFYGHIVEHGGTKSAPRPFLTPALEAQRGPAVRRVTIILRGL